MYLSPFKDIWGSRIIFAGPNKEFTKANKELIGGSNHAVYMLNQDIEEIQGLGSSKKVRFKSEGEVLTSFYTSPIEDDILQEMGFEPGYELEKYMDEPGFLANFLNTGMLEKNSELYCEWYKIFINNIHLLDLRPNKWLKNGRLPVLDDIVLFVFLDSEYGKGGSEVLRSLYLTQ